jgi:hypothetical protein
MMIVLLTQFKSDKGNRQREEHIDTGETERRAPSSHHACPFEKGLGDAASPRSAYGSHQLRHWSAASDDEPVSYRSLLHRQPASTFKKCDGPPLPPLGPRAQSWGVRAPQRPDLNPFSPRPPPTTPSMSRTSSTSTSCDKATPFPVTATSAPAIVAQVDDTHLTLLRETALASLRQNKRKVSSSSLNDSGTTTTTEPSVFTTTPPTSAPASLMSRKPTPPPLQQQDYYEAYYGGYGYDDTYYEEPPRDEFSNCIISDVDASSDEEDDEETMAQDCDDNVNGSKSLCPSAKVLKQTREQVVVYLQSLLEEHAYLRQPTQAPATSNGSSDIFLQRERQRVLVEEQIDALEREIERREQEAEVSRAL